MNGSESSEKRSDYYDTARIDLVPLLPQPVGRVLDVGCGAGATGRLLRARGASRLVGIELNETAALRAAEVYDEVHTGPVEEMLSNIHESFDTVCCYDVLEHLVDPWEVLRQLRGVLVPGGRLHVSVPNARHLSLAIDLFVRGTFGYREWGHRDISHLRWFTPRDIESGIEAAGYSISGRSHPAVSRWRRLLAKLTRGRSSEFLVWQWQLLAIRDGDTRLPTQ